MDRERQRAIATSCCSTDDKDGRNVGQLVGSATTGNVVWQMPTQSPTQSPVQSPVQSVIQAPMKVHGGGPSVQFVRPVPRPTLIQILQQIIIQVQRPVVHQHVVRRGGGGGGGATQPHVSKPESRIQAQQNHGGSLVNRESRSMPADYSGHVTSDRGKRNVTHSTGGSNGKPKSTVSAQHNGGSTGSKGKAGTK
jgi:hypothetical protein